MFKKSFAFLTAFAILLVFPLRCVYTSAILPTTYPIFKDTAFNNWDNSYNNSKGMLWASMLLYNSSNNDYDLIHFTNSFEYIDADQIYLTYKNGCFRVERQPHISSNQRYFMGMRDKSEIIDDKNYCTFYTYNINDSWYLIGNYGSPSCNSLVFPDYEIAGQLPAGYEVIACTHDLIYKDENGKENVLYYGSESLYLSYFEEGFKPNFAPHTVDREPPTEAPTEAPTSKPDTSQEQLDTSKGILGTLKDVLSFIINLPSNIANALSSLLDSLEAGITLALNTIKDDILEGLKLLFVPSNDNKWYDAVYLFKEKFGFVFQIFELGDFLLHYNFSESPPDFSMNFDENTHYLDGSVNGVSGSGGSGSHGGGGASRPDSGHVLHWGTFTVDILDLGLIEPYRQLIRNISIAVMWYFFLRKLRKKLPDVINGQSSSED